jgi:hypothetical protein
MVMVMSHIQNNKIITLSLPPRSTSFQFSFLTLPLTMSNNVDWDSKLVIGAKAKAPKVTKNSADLNGALRQTRNDHMPL